MDTLLSHTANADRTFTDTDRFDFPAGQVVLSDIYSASISTNSRSCVSTISVAGTCAIAAGAGRFAGARGGGGFTAAGVFVAGRDATGRCLGLDFAPIAFSEVVRGTGTTELAGTASR